MSSDELNAEEGKRGGVCNPAMGENFIMKEDKNALLVVRHAM